MTKLIVAFGNFANAPKDVTFWFSFYVRKEICKVSILVGEKKL